MVSMVTAMAMVTATAMVTVMVTAMVMDINQKIIIDIIYINNYGKLGYSYFI